jgi:hypothetical protein
MTLGIDLTDAATDPAEARRVGVAGRARRVRRPGRRFAQGARMTDLTCYGRDIEALADLAGDFDLRSPVDTRAWYRQTGRRSPTGSAPRSSSRRSSGADAAP